MKKYLQDLQKRIEIQPKSVSYKMLVKAIPAELHSKSIPQFVKNEICRSMLQVEQFVSGNDWARISITKSLMKLYHAVKDVKPNHEGFVRVEYAYFREKFDSLREMITPPQLIEMPTGWKVIIDRIRSGLPVSDLTWGERLGGVECVKRRRALLDSQTVQHYRIAGIRIFGSMSQDIDVPQIVAEANDVKKLIHKLRKCVLDNNVLQLSSVDIVLTAAEVLLQQDAIWFLTCTKIRESLANILQALTSEGAKTLVHKEVESVLNSAIPYIKGFDDWIRIEKINRDKLEAAAYRNHLTPDEMLMQAKSLQNKRSGDCP